MTYSCTQWDVFTNAGWVAAITPSKMRVTLSIAHAVAELIGPASSHIGSTPSEVSMKRDNNSRQHHAANLSSGGRWLFNGYHVDCLRPLHEDPEGVEQKLYHHD
jgi:hypothetical protein